MITDNQQHQDAFLQYLDAEEKDTNRKINLSLGNPAAWSVYSSYFEKLQTIRDKYLSLGQRPEPIQQETGLKRVKAIVRQPPIKNTNVNGWLKGSPALIRRSDLVDGYITANGNLERLEDVEWLEELPAKQPQPSPQQKSTTARNAAINEHVSHLDFEYKANAEEDFLAGGDAAIEYQSALTLRQERDDYRKALEEIAENLCPTPIAISRKALSRYPKQSNP